MKRKISAVAISLMLMTSMTACLHGEQEESVINTKNQMLLNSGSMYVYTFQDNETEVWYIATSKGITPRLNADGSLYTTRNNQ